MGLSEKARAYLREPRFAVMATLAADGSAQQSVVWYELRGDQIMMNTRRGRLKDDDLRRDPRLSICVPDGYTYVTIWGEATLVDDQARAQADILALAIRYHGRERAEQQARDQFRKEERVTILLPTEHVIEYGFE